MDKHTITTEDRVRNHPVCPLCYMTKTFDLVVCWPCYRRTGLRNGNPLIEARIRAFGERLAEVNA
jgi:hypothetical protein